MPRYLRFEGVLGAPVNGSLYTYALQKNAAFARSRTSPSQHYPDWRRSTVLFGGDFAPFAERIEREVHARLHDAVQALGLPTFEVGSTEIQLTSHNDGEYYHWHTDSGSPDTRTRTLTFVYYFHHEPKAYSGGELVLYDDNGGTEVVEPQNDMMILFASSRKHEVRPVACPSRRFEDGRFTINGWLRRRTAPRADYFDAKIFSFPSRSGVTTARGEPPALPAPPSAPATLPVPDEGVDLGRHALAVLDLQSELRRRSSGAGKVDTYPRLSGERFFDGYYHTNRPVLLKGAMGTSPAVARWTPETLAQRFGSVPVTLTTGRDQDPDYERNFSASLQTVTLHDLVARIAREPRSNDYYLVARNYFFDQPALWPLRGELEPPADLVDLEGGGPGTVKLWLGPSGTRTPFHFDEHSILFAQIHGRKHVKLVPPYDTARMYPRRPYYSAIDPERVDLSTHPAYARADVADVLVEPGDLLFLPAGWWHWVRALDVSISVTFSSFCCPERNTSLRTR